MSILNKKNISGSKSTQSRPSVNSNFKKTHQSNSAKSSSSINGSSTNKNVARKPAARTSSSRRKNNLRSSSNNYSARSGSRRSYNRKTSNKIQSFTTNLNKKNKINANAKRPSAEESRIPKIAQKAKEARDRKQEKKKIANSTSTRILSINLGKKREQDFNIKGSKFGKISSRVKKYILIILIAVSILAIGITCGVFAFKSSTSAKISVPDETKSALSKIQENEPFYMLFCANSDDNAENKYNMIMLARINPNEKNAIIVSIPPETYVTSPDGGGTTLKEITENKGDKDLINSVSSFAEVGIAQFVKLNSDGIKALVDNMDGIEVELKEEIDDPKAGNKYIPAGKSKLDGESTLVMLRATDFSGGSAVIYQNQREFAKGLANSVFSLSKSDMTVKLDQLSGSIKTSMSMDDCLAMTEKFSGLSSDDIQDTSLPGYKSTRDGKTVFIVSASEWKNIRTQMSYGKIPSEKSETTINDIQPGSFTIHVRNGAGINGGANMVSDQLKSMGFNVVSTDNAEQFLYSETLIIYTDDKNKQNAEAVKNSLNNGRLVQGAGIYELQTDIMVIIGSDLKV